MRCRCAAGEHWLLVLQPSYTSDLDYAQLRAKLQYNKHAYKEFLLQNIRCAQL
jgi:hypothetical protein